MNLDRYMTDYQSFHVESLRFRRVADMERLDEGAYDATLAGVRIHVFSEVRRGEIVLRIVEWHWMVKIAGYTYRSDEGYGLPREAAEDAVRFLSKALAKVPHPVVA